MNIYISNANTFYSKTFSNVFKFIKMISVEMYYSSSEEEQIAPIAQRRRQRPTSNIFDLPDDKFVTYFRLTKPSFQYVLELIKPKLTNMRSTAVSATTKLATTLRFLAQGSYQVSVGNDFNITLAQPTVSNVINETLTAMEQNLCPVWVNMEMSEAEKSEAKEAFYLKAGIPGVILCIDGTHIKIIAPGKEHEHLYYNRKGYYSINAMIACDHKMRIRFVDARYPGASHDSFVWNCSALRAALRCSYDAGNRNSWVLGDAGYPLEPYIMTPYRSATEQSPESMYNFKHSQTRNIIERVIGALKSRFRCSLGARQLHYKPKKVTKIVNVCAALHNICIHHNNLFIDDEQLEGPGLRDANIEQSFFNDSPEAVAIRNKIRDSLIQ